MNSVSVIEVKSLGVHCQAFPDGAVCQHFIVRDDDIILAFITTQERFLVATLRREDDMTDVGWLGMFGFSRRGMHQEKIHRPTDVAILINDALPCRQTMCVPVVHHVVIQAVFLPINRQLLDFTTHYSIFYCAAIFEWLTEIIEEAFIANAPVLQHWPHIDDTIVVITNIALHFGECFAISIGESLFKSHIVIIGRKKAISKLILNHFNTIFSASRGIGIINIPLRACFPNAACMCLHQK